MHRFLLFFGEIYEFRPTLKFAETDVLKVNTRSWIYTYDNIIYCLMMLKKKLSPSFSPSSIMEVLQGIFLVLLLY